MTFKEWIKKHEGKDTPFGDLAADVKHDSRFPTECDYPEGYDYLRSKCSFQMRGKVLRTFREAWAAYAKENGISLPSEAVIERKFCKSVEKIGGLALKFTPSGWAGAPDRIVLLPGGIVKFVELKVLGAEPREIQKLRLVQLKTLGVESFVIDSERDIEAFIERVEYEMSDLPDLDYSERLRYDDIEGVFRP